MNSSSGFCGTPGLIYSATRDRPHVACGHEREKGFGFIIDCPLQGEDKLFQDYFNKHLSGDIDLLAQAGLSAREIKSVGDYLKRAGVLLDRTQWMTPVDKAPKRNYFLAKKKRRNSAKIGRINITLIN